VAEPELEVGLPEHSAADKEVNQNQMASVQPYQVLLVHSIERFEPVV
jgi:hypothetical protein